MLIGLALGGLGLVGLVVAAAFFVLAGVGLDRPVVAAAPSASPLANPSPQPPPAPPASGVPTVVSVPPPAPEPSPGRIAILSEPSGAEVLVDGVSVGNTPFTTPALPPGRSVTVELRAAGHDPARLTLGADAPASQRVVLGATPAARPAARPTWGRRPVAPTSVSSSPSGAPRPAAARPTEVVDPWGSP
jgi:2-oxoglutarate dehydrogenase E2 component (dihydrolipoamide succinyltransferase)